MPLCPRNREVNSKLRLQNGNEIPFFFLGMKQTVKDDPIQTLKLRLRKETKMHRVKAFVPSEP